MAGEKSQRFPIAFDSWYALLSNVLLLSPANSYVEVEPTQIQVRMGWAFQASIPRSSIVSAKKSQTRTISRGVHGFAGRWLVNGSADGLVTLELAKGQRGYVMGFPVGLTELMVSLTDSTALLEALETPPA